jgi:hypothetical protein
MLLFLGSLILSARWLANHDSWEEAIFIISQIQGKGDANHPNVLFKVEEIEEVVRIEREAASITVFDLFKKDSLRRTIWAQT